MRERLAKLAHTSAKLRRGIFKEAGLGGYLLGAAIKHPGKALGTLGLGALGAAGSVGTFQKHRAGFDPEVQKAMLGPVPDKDRSGE